MKVRPQSRRIRDDNLKSGRKSTHEQGVLNFKRGKELQKEDRFLEALDAYIKATICDNNYFQAHCNMGTCFRSLGKYLEARNSYHRALGINPEDAITLYNLANLERLIGNYDKSILYY